MAEGPHPLLAALAARAQRRLAAAAAFRHAAAAAPWLLAAALALLGLRWAGLPWSPWTALLVILVPAVAVLVAWRRRPAPAAALAAWDRAAGRDELLLNAWSLVGHPGRLAAVHRARAEAMLPALDGALVRELPVPVPARAWWPLPVLALACAIPLPVQQAKPVERIAAAAGQALADEAKAITRDAARVDRTALGEGERRDLSDLEEKIRKAQEEAAAARATPEEALARLDELARQAEALAEKLTPQAIAGPALLAEMQKLADLAALAEALNAGDLAKAASAAAALAARIERPDASLEESRRLAAVLAQAAKAGDGSAAAQDLAQAATAAQAGRRAEAAAAMRNLAGRLDKAAARQGAGRQMAQLANRLRAAGGRLGAAPIAQAGRQGQGMGQLPRNLVFDPNGRGGGGQGRGGGPVPRSATVSPGRGGGGGGGAPVPGSGGAGMAPVPGGGLAGSQAGRGHNPASQAPTKPHAAGRQDTVTASMGDGPSTTVTAPAGDRPEAAATARRDDPVAVVDAEEQALAEEPLPPGRKAQVRDYFTLLRATLER